MKSGRLFAALLSAFLASFLVISGPTARAATDGSEASAFVEQLAENALGLLGNDDLSEAERLNQFRDLFRDGFAVQGIAKFSMGRYWRRADQEQREEYIALFEDVIIDTWSKRFTRYSGETLDVRNATLLSGEGDESVTIVHSLVWTSPEAPVRVDWRVASKGNIFKITDVTVEGVSMANTQRDEYTALARQAGVDGLLDRLRARSGEIENRSQRLASVRAYDGAIFPAAGSAPANQEEPVPVAATILAVQVASLRSEDRAKLAWERVQNRFPELLAGQTVRYEHVDLGERGTFTRVRFGAFGGYREAAALCVALAERGQDCLVVQR